MPNRKISQGPPELLDIIFKIANKFCMESVDYILQFCYDDVDSYLCRFYKVCIRGHREGQKVKITFIVKWHSDPEQRTAYRKAYQREYFFYQQIVPKLLELQNAFKVIEGLKMKFPNCAFASAERGKEAIVLADPLGEGFMFHDRFHKLDLDHVALAVKNLAKLHALSFVLEKYQPEEFEKIKESCHSDVQYSDTERMSKYMISLYNDSVDVVSDPVYKKMLQDCASDVLVILNRCTMPNVKYCSVCHGDYWNNNILFKYRKNRPVDTIFVDTQLVRFASPVTDVSYFIFMSTDHEFRLKYYDKVLALYYGTLSAVLRQCDLDTEEVYPENIFKEHLEKYAVFGLMEALISMKIITTVSGETLNKMKYEYRDDALCADDGFKNSDIYMERVNGVVNCFFSRNYSLDAVISKG